MIRIKTKEEIQKMKEGGQILSSVLTQLLKMCTPGVHTIDIDNQARRLLKESGAKPSFLNYQIDPSDPPYPSAVCISINDEVVHGPATPDRVIQDGDLVSLDIGAWYKGMATDMAGTVCVGKVSEEGCELSKHTKEALQQALLAVKAGHWVHDIGKAIENYIQPYHYGIIRDLVGHGVGHAVHEEPQIPHYHERRMPPVKLKEGMCIAIEPMISMGDWHIKQKDDGWTIITADGSLSAHWEVTIVVTQDGYELITPFPEI